MYHSESGSHPGLHAASLGKGAPVRVRRIIYFIGLTSLLTDISAEMVASVLPIYLLTVLRLSPLEYGLIDGFYNGSTALFRLLSAYWSDCSRRHKPVAAIGYALSLLSRCALPFAGFAGWMSVAVVVLVDRVGKGIRTAPRDALIAVHARPGATGAAFGVHRAMDAIGAIIGPLLAAGVLLWLPGRFDHVFSIGILFALLGLLVLLALVRPAAGIDTALQPATTITPKAMWQALSTPHFLLLASASALLSLFTLSDGMIYLGLQRQAGFDPARLPLLFVATAAVFMLLAIPVGRMADRYGHLRIFLLGYLALALVYGLCAALPFGGNLNALLAVILLGVYYAATDGVMAALAVGRLPAEMHATGLACIATLVSLGRMGSSILFGWIWQSAGQQQAVGFFGTALLLALCLAAGLALRLRQARPALKASP